MMRLKLTGRAKRDLRRIKNYIARQNSQAAEQVRQHIRAGLMRLIEFQNSGHSTDDPRIRILTITRYSYQVFYEVRHEEIVIHHIRDTRRKPTDPGEARSK